MKRLSWEWERRVAFGKETPQHGLDLEKLHIFWATSFYWWAKYQLRITTAWGTLVLFGCPSEKEDPVMFDSKSVISICFCWRSDFTSVLAAAVNLLSILKKSERSMWNEREGGSASCGSLLSGREHACHLWALVTHLSPWDDDDDDDGYCAGLYGCKDSLK